MQVNLYMRLSYLHMILQHFENKQKKNTIVFVVHKANFHLDCRTVKDM